MNKGYWVRKVSVVLIPISCGLSRRASTPPLPLEKLMVVVVDSPQSEVERGQASRTAAQTAPRPSA